MAVSAIQSSELIQYSNTGKPASLAHGQETGRVELRQTSYTTQISGYGQIRAAFDRLQSAASDLSGPGAFSTHVAASSKPSVVSAHLTSTNVSGSFDVDVLQLASAQTLVTSSQASPNTLIGSGEKTTLSVQFGVSSGTTFTADDAREAEQVTIDARNNTLNGIAAAVNTADVGVIAAVTFDGNSYQLRFSAEESGAENSFTLSASGDDVLESYLVYTPENTSQAVTRTVAAGDAKVRVNSVTVEASSNTVANALDGVTLKLKSVGSAQVSVGDNPENVIAQKVGNFLAAFNELQAQLKQPSAGDISIPPVVRNLKARVNEALEEADRNAGAFGGLAGVGIKADAAGNLQLDTDAFQTALGADRDAVTKIFTNDGAGFADLFAAVAHDLSKVTGREVSRLSDAARSEQARQAGSASGISLDASGFDGQYSQLVSLVQSVDKTDQTLNGLLLQGEAAQSSQSSLLNRLNSLANLATP
ncbi:MAG: flagellar filament capping protein FliD [Hydrogenophilales bacterium]|nr:flagellar filament capping protein FliD [Hydrogenophilales bacterium]